MTLLRVVLTAIVGATLACGLGCFEEAKGLPRTPPGKMIVETYPEPIDPATAPPRRLPPTAETVIIDNGQKSTIIYTCRYARCETLKETIENFASPEGTVQASQQLNVLLISDSNELINGLLRLVEELDRPLPQLLVEARIVEITLNSDFEYEMKDLLTQLPGGLKHVLQTSGIVLTTPGADPNPTQGGQVTVRPIATDSASLDVFIRLLVTKGYARILSSPNLVVGAGMEASIITGEEVPIQSATVVSGSVSTTTQFKRVGIKLRVTPLQITGDTAKLEIFPEVSTVTGFTAAGTSGVSNPIIAVRNVHSTLSLKDGEMLTVGGLLSSEDRKVVKKVPVLGDLPTVGVLFQSQRVQTVQTQLIFFLRVNILPEGRPYAIRHHRPGGGMEGVEDSPVIDGPFTRATQPDEEPLDKAPAPRREPRRINVAPTTLPESWLNRYDSRRLLHRTPTSLPDLPPPRPRIQPFPDEPAIEDDDSSPRMMEP